MVTARSPKIKYRIMTDNYKSQAGDSAGTSIQHQPNRRQRILVVDDDPDIRRLNTEVLIGSGYHVDAAEDGAAAWDALQLNDYDLIVTDNDMPKVTGVELIQKLQAFRRDLPVIMATGNLSDEQLERGNPLQPAVILLKPHSFNELLEAVKAVLLAVNEGCAAIVLPPDWRTQPSGDRFQL